jgi:hypothetical protein
VFGSVAQEDGASPKERLEDGLGCARTEHVCVATEEGGNNLRITEENKRVSGRQPQRERVPKLLMTLL